MLLLAFSAAATLLYSTHPVSSTPAARRQMNPPLRIDGVIPPAGQAAGGQQIKLIGAFDNLLSVTLGGNPATWSYFGGTSQIIVATPAHAAGAVSIDLTPTMGSPYSKSNAFAYLPTTFTDNTLVAGVTTAKAQHILELRQVADALRAVAGLGPASWTDPTLPPASVFIKAVHITELRSNLESAVMLLGYSGASYTDPALNSGVVIKRIHIEELRQRIRNLATLTANGPLTINASADQVITLPNAATLAGTATGGGPLVALAWSKVSGPGSVLFSQTSAAVTNALFGIQGIYVLRLTAMDTLTTVMDDVQVTVNADPTPPPVMNAPPVDMTVATTIGDATEFLYTGPNAIQTGVAPGTINKMRAAVLKGRVLDKNNNPLALVKITILDHPEFGQTLSRADGRFDMAVNGGGVFSVKYERVGCLSLQRTENVPWQDYCGVPDVVMIGYDANVTLIDLLAATPIQVVQSSVSTDTSGTRRTRLLFKQGTTATMKLPGGALQGLSKFNVRATEFTVGTNGANAMPGALPANSAYTYAVEYSLDEAVAAQATETTFSQPVVQYNENFLSFPVGIDIPSGAYDRTTGQWVASASGRVIKILSITSGTASLDVTGGGTPATDPQYAALGINLAERQTLATLYTTNQVLWRVPIIHFSPWDSNWPFGPPAGAGGPGGPPPQCDT